MSKTAPAPEAEEGAAENTVLDQPVDGTSFELSITEWALRKSKDTPAVELLNAFAQREVAAGRVKALESEFEGRFAAFASEPA